MTPTIYSRADWGAGPTDGPLIVASNPRKKLYWHHFGAAEADGTPITIPATWSFEQECAQLRATERFHIEVRKFRAIAYSIVDFPSGRLYAGRDLPYDHGANYGNENRESLSFCFAGNYDAQYLTPAQIVSAQGLVALAKDEGFLAQTFSNLGHRDEPGVNKSCPGNHVYPRLAELIEEPDDMPDPRLTDGMVAVLEELLKLPKKTDPASPAVPKYVGQRIVEAVKAVEDGGPGDGHKHTLTLAGTTD